jgi:hypothetical protein
LAAEEPALLYAREEYEALAAEKAHEIALEMQPRHRAAVKSISMAIESLSRAIAAEEAVRYDFASRAPQTISTSPLLPNYSDDLGTIKLGVWEQSGKVGARSTRRRNNLMKAEYRDDFESAEHRKRRAICRCCHSGCRSRSRSQA